MGQDMIKFGHMVVQRLVMVESGQVRVEFGQVTIEFLAYKT